MSECKLDEIGYWSEVKLEIIKKYATAYAKILSKQKNIHRFIYIDAFAGAGTHISKETGASIPGSPSIALQILPPFSEYHFIDLSRKKIAALKSIAEGRKNVFFYEEDCNNILSEKVFPHCRYKDYARGLCLLDPYALSVDWQVLETAGKMGSVDVFYNFMIMDANMNIFWFDQSKVSTEQIARMDKVWGDHSWKDAAYRKTEDLFDEIEEKTDNQHIADAFRKRLSDVAGFKYVPNPMPMRNSRGAVIYYLYFASPNKTGHKIVDQIFSKYRKYGI